MIVNATVRFTGCTDRPNCTNDFVILHRFDTNDPALSEAQQTDTSNYQYSFGDEQSSRIQQNPSGGETTIIRRFQRLVDSNYTYFGIQDIGTFGNVIRLFVYYEVCPRREGNLIVYPEIPLPAQGSTSPITRTARCVEYAHNTTSLETRAHSDGRCEQQATCVCDLGFVSQNEDQCIGMALMIAIYKIIDSSILNLPQVVMLIHIAVHITALVSTAQETALHHLLKQNVVASTVIIGQDMKGLE